MFDALLACIQFRSDADLDKERRNVTLENLRPGKIHQVWIVTRTASPKVTESEHLSLATFEQLNLVTVTKRTPRTILLSWTAPSTDQIRSHRILYPPRNGKGRNMTEAVVTQPRQVYEHRLEDLIPGTDYVISVAVVYHVDMGALGDLRSNYSWPKEETVIVSFIFSI